MMLETFDIDGRTLTMPVEVRRARNWVATYSVAAEPLRRLIGPTGLELAQARAGKGLLTLGFVEYEDTDLGAYHEFMVSVLVRPHDAGPATARERRRELRRNRIGAYIHRLPVDDAFSMAAGRGIWGYPKTMMSFTATSRGGAIAWALHDRETPAVTMHFSGVWFPMFRTAAPPTYTMLDDVLRLTRWESRARRISWCPRGVRLELGQGEIADELRSLGLPKKALLSIRTGEMGASFASAKLIERPASVESRGTSRGPARSEVDGASVSSEKGSQPATENHSTS
jgi:hypothetical protein